MTETIPGWTSYNVNYALDQLSVGINKRFFQYKAPAPPYKPVIVTGNENAMWWVQPVFSVIVSLLLLAGFLAIHK